ncbi:MAG: hypothetical protein ACRC3Z_07895 [Phocaeicola sp.]
MIELHESAKSVKLDGKETDHLQQKVTMLSGEATLLVDLAHEEDYPVHIHRGRNFKDKSGNSWVDLLLEYHRKDERVVFRLFNEVECVFFSLT